MYGSKDEKLFPLCLLHLRNRRGKTFCFKDAGLSKGTISNLSFCCVFRGKRIFFCEGFFCKLPRGKPFCIFRFSSLFETFKKMPRRRDRIFQLAPVSLDSKLQSIERCGCWISALKSDSEPRAIAPSGHPKAGDGIFLRSGAGEGSVNINCISSGSRRGICLFRRRLHLFQFNPSERSPRGSMHRFSHLPFWSPPIQAARRNSVSLASGVKRKPLSSV